MLKKESFNTQNFGQGESCFLSSAKRLVPTFYPKKLSIDYEPVNKTNYYFDGGSTKQLKEYHRNGDGVADLTDEQQMILADIQNNPRILFTKAYAPWRDYFRRVAPGYLDRLYNNLSFEEQEDIYNNNREAWGTLSNEAKSNFGANLVRNKSNEVAPYVVGGLAATAVTPYLIGGLAMNPYSLYTVTAAGAAFVNDMVEEQTPKLSEQHYPSMHSEPHNDVFSTAYLIYSSPDIYEWDTGKIALFQSLIGLPKTGIIDIPTLANYDKIKNEKYQINPTNSSNIIERIGMEYHPETQKQIEYDWSQEPGYKLKDGCSQWVRKKYDKVVGNSSEVGFHADAWQLIKKIEKAGGDMLFNIYDDKKLFKF